MSPNPGWFIYSLIKPVKKGSDWQYDPLQNLKHQGCLVKSNWASRQSSKFSPDRNELLQYTNNLKYNKFSLAIAIYLTVELMFEHLIGIPLASHWIPAILFLRDFAPSTLSNFIFKKRNHNGGKSKNASWRKSHDNHGNFFFCVSFHRSFATDEVSAETGHASNNLAVKQEDCFSSAYRDACLCSNGLGQKNLPPWDLNKSSWQGRHMLRLSALLRAFPATTKKKRNPTPNGQRKTEIQEKIHWSTVLRDRKPLRLLRPSKKCLLDNPGKWQLPLLAVECIEFSWTVQASGCQIQMHKCICTQNHSVQQ